MAIMNEVENMHQHVNNPREQVADAEALLGLTRHLAASVKTHTAGGVTPAEFVSCLIRDFGQQNSMKRPSKVSRNISWRNIGSLVTPIFMSAPRCRTMIGPMENKLKPRKVHAKRSRTIAKERTKEVENGAELVTDTDRNLLVMFEILKKKKKARVENLMLNRNSFAQTVENLFALSFLVKDGRVRIDVEENGSQVVVPTNGPSAKEIKSGAVRNNHFIFRFDFNDWKLMKTLVPEGEEMMPRRDTFRDANNVKMEKCDQDFSPSNAIPISDSQVLHSAPVYKFSKNDGRTMLNSFDNGTLGNWSWSCKRKRSVK
ncbi:non-structural maintenance of chromosomes element 4 homolog a [Phtheirospermum japonicum]|uniref:Non-structural maintenance of chromosomes element 4 n=1 Tax=Phtheirospermum japonicum TaxID=374723 RepID=A0A830AYQ2_9LAMI|nr:non-structural maintenance of chromosomes element 4 homolog a [Phtheirospermum japonicum]